MKTYTIVGGVNGVGKSSLLGVLSSKRSDLGIIVDADKITAKLGGDRIKGGKEAVRTINDSLLKGLNFTQETTLSGRKTVKTAELARSRGYHIRLYYVAVNSLEESLIRIENRVKKGGHDISKEDVKRRFENRFEDLEKILPLCDEVCFFDNENGFVYAGEYQGGEIKIAGDNIPVWLRELVAFLEKERQ